MRSFSVPSGLLGIGLALVGCRGDSNKNKIDSGGGGDGTANTVTIQQVQSDAIPPGTPVNLAGVVVTAIDTYGSRVNDVWVEEPEGGPSSGVHVFNVDPTAVMALQPGDIVSVTNAQKASFALSADMTGRTEIELEPPMGSTVAISKTGTGTVPAPAVVDALEIGKMTDLNNNGDRSAAWRMWDGVLITVNNVTEVNGVAQVSGKTPDPTLKKFSITGDAAVESSLADFPASGLGYGTCLASVTGVLSYFFDYQILNRTSGDVVTGGTMCPMPETGASCSNTIDDDGNGFLDCNDNSCIIDQTSCRNTVTITQIDQAVDANPGMPTLPAGNPIGVEIGNGTTTDVYVTAIARNGKDFWVSTGLTAGADGGLYVFAGGKQYVATTDLGKTVHLIGSLSAYNGGTTGGETLPELQAIAVQNIAGAGTTVPVSNKTAATLLAASTGRPYVGSLVQLSNVKVVSPSDAANHNNSTLQQTGTMFEGMGDATLIDSTNYPAGTCLQTLTGIWSYDVYSHKYAIEPVTLGAKIAGTNCT